MDRAGSDRGCMVGGGAFRGLADRGSDPLVAGTVADHPSVLGDRCGGGLWSQSPALVASGLGHSSGDTRQPAVPHELRCGSFYKKIRWSY